MFKNTSKPYFLQLKELTMQPRASSQSLVTPPTPPVTPKQNTPTRESLQKPKPKLTPMNPPKEEILRDVVPASTALVSPPIIPTKKGNFGVL